MKYHKTLEHLPFNATISVLAHRFRQFGHGVSGNIGDCGVGLTPQMCNRVTNHEDMSTFSKPYWKIVHVMNIHNVFSCGLHFSSDLTKIVQHCESGIYHHLNKWVMYFLYNLNYI